MNSQRQLRVLTQSIVLLSVGFHLNQQLSVRAAAEAHALNQEVISRGRNHAVFRSVNVRVNENGQPALETNQFTLLENGLHYLENGQWRDSEDLIESFPEERSRGAARIKRSSVMI